MVTRRPVCLAIAPARRMFAGFFPSKTFSFGRATTAPWSATTGFLIGLSSTGFTPGIQTAITDAGAEQQANEAQFNGAATASERQLFSDTLSAPTLDGAQAQVRQAVLLAATASPSPGAEDPVIANAESSL